MLFYVTLLAYSILLYYFTRGIYHVILQQYVYFCAPRKDLKKLAKTDWADANNGMFLAVTGSTQGIGKYYALELAKQGFNILLIARNAEKMENVKEEILKEVPNVQVEYIVFDFSNASSDDYEKTFKEPMRKVGFLVNNVGEAYQIPDKIHKLQGGLEENRNLILINMLSFVMLSQICVEYMEQRGGGIIVNVGSSAGDVNFIYYSAYLATKSAMKRFTDVLRVEYPTITFQQNNPGWVTTTLAKKAHPTLFTRTPQDYSYFAVRTIGWLKETRGHWAHQLQFDLFASLPTFLSDIIFEKVLGQKKFENIDYLKNHMHINNGVNGKKVD